MIELIIVILIIIVIFLFIIGIFILGLPIRKNEKSLKEEFWELDNYD